jgi:glutamyl-tRNA synthetase
MKMADDEVILEWLRNHYQISDLDRLKPQLPELKDRAKTLLQLAEEAHFLVKTMPLDYDEKALAQLDEKGLKVVQAILSALSNLAEFNAQHIDETLRHLAQTDFDGKLGKVMMPFRAALTGRMVSPTLPLSAEILGKDEVMARLKAALALV